MTVLVTGAHGQLGQALLRRLTRSGVRVVGYGRSELDVRDPRQVREAISGLGGMGLVINCAAYTDVDKAEKEEEVAHEVNRDGARNVAVACELAGWSLVHISTDYVFDGSQRRPYLEDDLARPRNVYGASKLAGEEAVRNSAERHLILRTGWMFSESGSNFVKAMLSLADPERVINVVDDQVGCPTCAHDLATALEVLIAHVGQNTVHPWGTYHYCGWPEVTWRDFAEAVFEEAANVGGPQPKELRAIPSDEYPGQADRPAYSVLDCGRVRGCFGIVRPDWRLSLTPVVRSLLCASAGGSGRS